MRPLCYISDIISALTEHNNAIPEQVSIIGYDDIRSAAISQVPLTAISQATTKPGEIAATNLLHLIHHNEMKQELIQPFLVTRESG